MHTRDQKIPRMLNVDSMLRITVSHALCKLESLNPELIVRARGERLGLRGSLGGGPCHNLFAWGSELDSNLLLALNLASGADLTR